VAPFPAGERVPMRRTALRLYSGLARPGHAWPLSQRDARARQTSKRTDALTRPLRTVAAQQGRAEYLSLWAGQGVRLARRQAAAALIARLAHETEAVVQRLAVEHTN
jgi:NAD(P)H-dependent flavin oxidoreductase YrpB (nitropropane dioxygenase family)